MEHFGWGQISRCNLPVATKAVFTHIFMRPVVNCAIMRWSTIVMKRVKKLQEPKHQFTFTICAWVVVYAVYVVINTKKHTTNFQPVNSTGQQKIFLFEGYSAKKESEQKIGKVCNLPPKKKQIPNQKFMERIFLPINDIFCSLLANLPSNLTFFFGDLVDHLWNSLLPSPSYLLYFLLSRLKFAD